MKSSRAAVHHKTHAVPKLRFDESHALTSFAGLVLFQKLFALLDLKGRLRTCYTHIAVHPIFGHATIVLLLIVHLLLGYRQMRETRYYGDDPMVRRLLGLRRLPDVATMSRALAQVDETSVEKLRSLVRRLVLDRLAVLAPARVTLDFDGSVISTGRRAEGTAVGYNRKKKGQRSYYPLFCTVAQTAQVLDVLHRAGNVHDSRGAEGFIRGCIEEVRHVLPAARIELRMDAAFYADAIVTMLARMDVEFTISVPFERLTALKQEVEGRRRWRPIDDALSYFETHWKPNVWARRYRIVVVRQKAKLQDKEPIQLDLFVPHEYGFAFKAIVTNKVVGARKIVAYHNGRGAQEGVFAELKSQAAMGYVPTRTLAGNQTYMLAAVLAHDLARELHMLVEEPSRATTEQRAARWSFMQLSTLRRRLLQRAGRLLRPQGQLTLAMSANPQIETDMLRYLAALDRAA